MFYVIFYTFKEEKLLTRPRKIYEQRRKIIAWYQDCVHGNDCLEYTLNIRNDYVVPCLKHGVTLNA